MNKFYGSFFIHHIGYNVFNNRLFVIHLKMHYPLHTGILLNHPHIAGIGILWTGILEFSMECVPNIGETNEPSERVK